MRKTCARLLYTRGPHACIGTYKVGNLRTATSHSRSHELHGAADGEGITIVVGQLFVSCVPVVGIVQVAIVQELSHLIGQIRSCSTSHQHCTVAAARAKQIARVTVAAARAMQ